jgi:hypothetical protein
MFEILMVLLTLATMALGLLVWYLFEQNNEIRASFESRLKAIESLDGPFARKLADEGPAPLKRVLSLGIHLDARFWAETLQLTQPELDEIKTSILWHDVLSEKGAALEDFGKWFYSDVRVRIQEWRGGYAHIEVEYPYCPRKEPESIELYHGRSSADLWQFHFQSRPGGILGGSLWLKWDGHHIRLYAVGGRFGWASFMDPEPAPQNVFLAVPTEEGPRAEPYFRPDRRIEVYTNVYRWLSPWERCYEHLDLQKGLAWSLWIHDCDLFTRSQGNGSNAQRRLLAEWREQFAGSDAGKEWYERVAKSFEDAEAREWTELTKGSAAR